MERVIDNIHMLQRHGAASGILSVITENHLGHAKEYFDFLYENGITDTGFCYCYNPRDNIAIDPIKLAEFLCESFDIYYHSKQQIRVREFDNTLLRLYNVETKGCLFKERSECGSCWIDEEELKQKEVENIFDKYKEQLSYTDIMVWIQQTIRDSGVSYKKSKEILSITEKNEDNILYQLVALIYGSQNVSKTDISYVRKLKNAVEQFDKLYEQQMTESVDNQSILKEKLYVSRVLIQCLDYEGALAVLNSADKYGEMEEIIEYKLFCLKSLGRFEELEQKAYSYASKEMNEIAAYYSAIAYLKQGKISESLKQGVILEQMVRRTEAEKREYGMKLLYSYVQFLCIYNKATPEYDCRVREYNEEQLMILQNAPLLKNYIDTVNAIYNEKDYEKAKNYLYEIEKICPGLSMSMYLEGVIALEYSDYETAHRALMDCIKINDSNYAAIYSLAVVYDACEEYEKSYQMCKQAKEKMMTIDHGIDWYGIGAHIDHLMSLLKLEKGA